MKKSNKLSGWAIAGLFIVLIILYMGVIGIGCKVTGLPTMVVGGNTVVCK